MDFDTAKENIQPLRQGRRPDVLELALSEQSKDSLENEKRKRFEAISTYEGEDPLSVWWDYICWIEQSYPKGGNESGLDQVVLDCICAFDSERFPQFKRYQQDRRLIKLYIKYIDTKESPYECYRQLYEKGIGTLVADLYIAWSHYFDALNNYKEVEAIFLRGFDAGAQPMEDLTQARETFRRSMLQRENNEASREDVQEQMEERRVALTSLRAHKNKYVGSLRTGVAVRHENPGIIKQEKENVHGAGKSIQVHEADDEQGAWALKPNVSVIRSIIDSNKKKENVHEPGPWSKGNGHKKGGLFGKAGSSSHLDFAIMEDDKLPPIHCPQKLFELGIQLPPGFVSHNKPQKPWNVPVVIEEPLVPRAIPMYEKFLLYPNAETEISPEEYRGHKWFKDRGMNAPLREQYDHIWENKFESAIRIPPGFHKCNVKQVEEKIFKRFIESDESDTGVLQVPLHKIYPEGNDERSLEELLAEKFRKGLITILTEDDFETIYEDDEMDLTTIADHRQSIYQASRLSFVPRKSILRKSVMPPPPVEEFEEEDLKNYKKVEDSDTNQMFVLPGIVGIKRKFEETAEGKASDNKQMSAMKRGFIADTPPRLTGSTNDFKQPASVRFSILDDEDTCSTQQFNLFIKEQSVSTPVVKKTLQRVTPLATEEATQTNEVEVKSNKLPGNQSSPLSSPENQIENFVPKQLSTIMEMTESTQSTKSSVGQASTSNEIDFNPKTPKAFGFQKPAVVNEVDERLINPLAASFRMLEEQTVTCPKMIASAIRVPEIHSILVTPLKPCIDPPVEIAHLDLLVPQSNFSENSMKSSDHEITTIEVQEVKQPSICVKAPILDIPALKDFDLSSTHSFEVPLTQDFDALTIEQDQSIFNIPATQNFPVTIAQDASVISINQHDESILDIPATQAGEIPSLNFEIPATQHENIAIATEDFEIPETQLPAAEATSKPKVEDNQMMFNIYEDSIREMPLAKEPARNFAIADDEGTGFLHMSRKENLLVQPLKTVTRTVSDEFLDLLVSPQPKYQPKCVTNASVKEERKGEVSDLLKFSGAESLENSLKNLSIDLLKSATPTETTRIMFDEDLNTEMFGMALTKNKNSTLLLPALMKSEVQLDLSITMDDDELGLLPKYQEAKKDEFKVPQLPAPIAPLAEPAAAFKVFEDCDEDDDLGKSIYMPKEIPKDDDDCEEDEINYSFIPNTDNCYEHSFSQDDGDLSIMVKDAIKSSNGNPFDARLHEVMLDRCKFTNYLAEHISGCMLLKNVPKLKQGTQVECLSNDYTVMKFIAKGSFGSIYKVKNSKDGKVYAMKQEKPPNLWEYYICLELIDRLKNKEMIPAFMTIDNAIIARNYSIFVTQYSPYGSIIDVCNKHKNAANKHIDEYIVMVLTTQLLSIIDHLHGCRIIHADVKPDNFLLMSKIEFGMKVPAIQLIDFGCAIDMDWYNHGDTFNYVVTTDNFTCCEMLENRPWTYQTDLFGLAGSAHVMLFGKYMEVEKRGLTWHIKSHYPRYLNKFVWEEFFNTMLNVRGCDALPNLQALKDQIEGNIQAKQKFVCEKIADFNKILNN